MIEIDNNPEITALIIGFQNNDLSELEDLCFTLGIKILNKVSLSKIDQSPVYGVGSGKAKEIAAFANELDVDLLVFDFEISPRKQRNWEKLVQLPVIDRHEIILRIFAKRAKTKEAVLQIQLAKLEYSLPRLAHSYGDLARQRGGNYGSKGAGETQLELDQRQVRQKIQQLKKELIQVEKERQTQRKRRDKLPCPSVAIVGYTNAGKSTLLNALTGAEVLAEDKLFATLDPTTRRLNIKDCGTVLLTDTVGFISNLPHSLINAFKSTLEESKNAQLQLIVLDVSDPNVFKQYETVISVLQEIDANSIPKIIVLNKIDTIDKNNAVYLQLIKQFPKAITISAKEKKGFDILISEICNELLGKKRLLKIPIEKNFLLNDLRKNGIIVNESWQEQHIYVEARIGPDTDNQTEKPRLLAIFEPYLID